MNMLYSFVAMAVALASIVGAWNLTKEALKGSEPHQDP